MLSGDLSTVSLPGLLQLLTAERRSGLLRVFAPGGEGLLWLDDGDVVHAERTGQAPVVGEAAVHATVLAESGRFEFDPGSRAPRRTVSASTDHLLMEAACRRDHLQRDAPGAVEGHAVPVFAPVPEGTVPPRFSTLQWRLLACIDGRADVASLGQAVGLPDQSIREMVRDLVRAGVLSLR